MFGVWRRQWQWDDSRLSTSASNPKWMCRGWRRRKCLNLNLQFVHLHFYLKVANDPDQLLEFAQWMFGTAFCKCFKLLELNFKLYFGPSGFVHVTIQSHTASTLGWMIFLKSNWSVTLHLGSIALEIWSSWAMLLANETVVRVKFYCSIPHSTASVQRWNFPNCTLPKCGSNTTDVSLWTLSTLPGRCQFVDRTWTIRTIFVPMERLWLLTFSLPFF